MHEPVRQYFHLFVAATVNARQDGKMIRARIVIASEADKPLRPFHWHYVAGTIAASGWTEGEFSDAGDAALAEIERMGKKLINYCHDASCTICKSGEPCH